MWGAIIGAALSAGSNIYGGISASQAIRKSKRELEEQRLMRANWYARTLAEDATARADAQALLRRTEDAIKKRNRAAAGAAAVMGDTDAGAAATAEANAKAIADTNMAILTNAEQRREEASNRYIEGELGIQSQRQAIKQQEAEAIANAVKAAGSAAGSIGNGIDSYKGSK